MTERGVEIPTLTQEYSRLTRKYRERLDLDSNQIVAKIFSINSPSEARRIADQERDRFKLLIDLGQDPAALHFPVGLVPTTAEQVDELELDQLLTLYIINEMSRGNIAQGYDYIDLMEEVENVVTLDIKTKFQDIDSLRERYLVFATIITFNEDSSLLANILAASG